MQGHTIKIAKKLSIYNRFKNNSNSDKLNDPSGYHCGGLVYFGLYCLLSTIALILFYSFMILRVQIKQSQGISIIKHLMFFLYFRTVWSLKSTEC